MNYLHRNSCGPNIPLRLLANFPLHPILFPIFLLLVYVVNLKDYYHLLMSSTFSLKSYVGRIYCGQNISQRLIPKFPLFIVSSPFSPCRCLSVKDLLRTFSSYLHCPSFLYIMCMTGNCRTVLKDQGQVWKVSSTRISIMVSWAKINNHVIKNSKW